MTSAHIPLSIFSKKERSRLHPQLDQVHVVSGELVGELHKFKIGFLISRLLACQFGTAGGIINFVLSTSKFDENTMLL